MSAGTRTAWVLLLLVAVGGCSRSETAAIVDNAGPATGVPRFEYDPTWPKTLPNNWIFGQVGALYVEPKTDHVWLVQRPSGTTRLGERFGLTGDGECCFPAPPVMEFDREGNLIQAWGPIHGDNPNGPRRTPIDYENLQAQYGQMSLGEQAALSYPLEHWPTNEHGIFVDHAGHVWVDSQNPPSALVKMSRDGQRMLLRIGKTEARTNRDTENLAGPTGIHVDPESNEVFVADGYRNRRVIVFDATTGAYKRQWGAYGKPPIDAQAPETNIVRAARAKGLGAEFEPDVRRQQFDHVHCLRASHDGLLYVCDRANNRIQVFRKDGTFVSEALVAPKSGDMGSTLDLAFSADPEQRLMYIADGPNHKIWILRRSDMTVIGSFGSGGTGGGQFLLNDAIGVDSQGNVYVGETIPGHRVQKFRLVAWDPAT